MIKHYHHNISPSFYSQLIYKALISRGRLYVIKVLLQMNAKFRFESRQPPFLDEMLTPTDECCICASTSIST